MGIARAKPDDPLPATVVNQIGHTSWVTSVAFSPDGRLALSGSWDSNLKLWEVATGRALRSFTGHAGQIKSVAFSPDGRLALSGSDDKTLKLWEVATGRALRSFTGHADSVRSVAFSPNGRLALSGSDDKTLKLWEVATGRELRSFTGHSSVVDSVAFSPDGRLALSSSGDNTLKLWEVATGRERRSFTGHKGGGSSVAFSPDGQLALAGTSHRTLKLWEVETGRELRSFTGHLSRVDAVAFSPDGRLALSGSGDNTLRLWEVATGRELRSFTGHASLVTSVAFSPDGRLALSGSSDEMLKLWEVETGRELRSFTRRAGVINSVAFSPDGRLALSGREDKTLKLWEVETGRELRSFTGHAGKINSVGFSPNGRLALSGSEDTMLKLWEVATGRELRSFTGHAEGVSSVAFSDDGRQALSGSYDKTLKLWEVETGRELRSFTGHAGEVYSAAFSPDGRLALSGSVDETLKLWEVETGRELRSLTRYALSPFSVAFSPDGRLALSGSYDTTLNLWEVATGRELRSFTGHVGIVTAVAFSPDSRLALSGSGDNTLKLWEISTGRELRSFTGHAGDINSVAFSPDGRLALSGSSDATVRLWNAKLPKSAGSTEDSALLATMSGSASGEWLTVTPAGFFTASAKGAETILHVVRGFESYSIWQFYEHLHRPDLVEARLSGDTDSKYHNAAYTLNLTTILDSGPAPKLERLYDREHSEGATLRLAVRLTDRGGGIGEKVIWRVNGTVQGRTTAAGLGGPARPGRYVVMEQELFIDPSIETKIEVVGYNGKGLLATEPLRFSFDRVQGIVPEPHKLYVLAIGVSEYKRPDWRLKFAASDAEAISKALQAVGKGVFGENIVIMPPLLNDQGTEPNIAAAFQRLSQMIKPRDVFVLFLSGHGRSIAGKGWYFLPPNLEPGQRVEEYAIGQDKIQNWLSQLPAQNSVIILDSCEAGATEGFRSIERERDTVMAQLKHATGRSTISAAGQGKAAYEGYEQHGLLTYALLEALNRKESESDDVVDLYTVGGYISRRVPEISLQQFNLYQQPKSILEDNFSLGRRQPILKSTEIACELPKTSASPSHVTSATVPVLQNPAGGAPTLAELKFRAGVTVIGCQGAWALISRQGMQPGYVRYEALERIE